MARSTIRAEPLVGVLPALLLVVVLGVDVYRKWIKT